MTTRYINSGKIHVFPCSYRTQTTDTAASPTNWDPEARLNTEKNFTNLATGLGKKSYIVSWDGTENTKLCCVIGGYYFEIDGETITTLNEQYLCINKAKATIATSDDTTILGTFENDSTDVKYLDRKIGTATDYSFTGLVVSDTPTTGTDRLKVVENGTIKYDEFLPNTITRGQNENTVVIGKNGTYINNNDTVLVVANGVDAANRSNIVEVTKTGIKDTGTIEIAGSATFNGAVSINDTLTTATNKQVTINGNLDATNGLDITGASLTVGGAANAANFSVTTDGNIDTNGNLAVNGTATIGETGGTVILSKAADTSGETPVHYTTEVKDILKVDGDLNATKGINITGANLIVNTDKFAVDATNGNTTIAGDLTLNKQKDASTAGTAYAVKITDGKVEKNDLTFASPATCAANTTEFIDTVSQSADGQISATKKKFELTAGDGQGQIKLNGNNISVTEMGVNSNPTFADVKANTLTASQIFATGIVNEATINTISLDGTNGAIKAASFSIKNGAVNTSLDHIYGGTLSGNNSNTVKLIAKDGTQLSAVTVDYPRHLWSLSNNNNWTELNWLSNYTTFGMDWESGALYEFKISYPDNKLYSYIGFVRIDCTSPGEICTTPPFIGILANRGTFKYSPWRLEFKYDDHSPANKTIYLMEKADTVSDPWANIAPGFDMKLYYRKIQ